MSNFKFFKNPKFFFVLIILMTCPCWTFAQQNKKELSTKQNIDKNLHLIVYRSALKANDYSTAIVALNYVVASEPKGGLYRDSLAYLYYSANNFYQSLFWCNEILAEKKNDLGLLEIKAASLRNIGQIIPAIETYEFLLTQKPNPIYLFNLAELQYQIKRLYECISSTQLAEKIEISDLSYSYKKNETESSKTPIMAAFYNYRGLAYYELGQKSSAKLAFEKSLSVDTSFSLAKSNLLTVTSEIEGQNSLQQTPGNNSNKEAIRKE